MAVMRGNCVGGNWLIKWDEVKKIPLYSHRLTHRKRVTSELHDSYFRSMTITQAIPKIAEVTHPDRQISEEIAEAWRRVHITAWEFEGNIRPTNWVPIPVEFDTQGASVVASRIPDSWSRDVAGKATPGRGDPREPRWSLGSREDADKMQQIPQQSEPLGLRLSIKRTGKIQRDGHKFGVKILLFMFGL